MTREEFIARFPDFSIETVDKYFDIVINIYDCYFKSNCDGKCGEEAISQLLAHLMWRESQPTDGGIKSVQSKTVGNVSVSYGDAYGKTGWSYGFFNGSRYGQNFLYLVGRCMNRIPQGWV